MAGMAGMAGTRMARHRSMTTTSAGANNHGSLSPLLRPVAAGGHQCCSLRHVRLQLLQADHRTRLAQFWRVHGIYRRAVCRDVRLSADHIFHVRLVGAEISWGGDPHWGPFHILSYLFIGGGFWILAEAWPTLYAAQRQGQLAQSGLYARVRHPQYIGFVLIMFGFLLQWPTILTLLMFPVLLFMYGRLALTEERDSAARFGLVWQEYASRVPRFVPRLG